MLSIKRVNTKLLRATSHKKVGVEVGGGSSISSLYHPKLLLRLYNCAAAVFQARLARSRGLSAASRQLWNTLTGLLFFGLDLLLTGPSRNNSKVSIRHFSTLYNKVTTTCRCKGLREEHKKGGPRE